MTKFLLCRSHADVRTFKYWETPWVRAEFPLDLLLKPAKEDLHHHEEVRPVWGVGMFSTTNVTWISPVDVMVLLPGLAFQELKVTVNITSN